MSSKPQKQHGYPLPEDEWTEETQTLCVTIPAGEAWLNAFRGQMYQLGKWWFWKRDESRPRAATDAAMTWRLLYTYEEGCGLMATQEDIAKGMYQAFNWLALQVATGQYANIALNTDEDGVVTIPAGDGAEEIPEDDPTSPDIDESAASAMGGAQAVSRAIEKFLDKCDSLYGAVNGTPATTLAAAQSIIKAYYPNDGAIMDTVIATYYTYRGSNGQLAFNTSAAFEGYMYCRGHNERAFQQWLIDSSGYAETKRQVVSDLITGLSEEFFTSYFAKGSLVPSTDYRAASCTKIATEQWTYPMQSASVAYVISGVLKANHRYQFDFSGSFTDADNPNIVQDAFWSHNLTTGVKTYIGFTWSISGITAPTSAEVPFKADHIYTVTREKTGGDNNGTITKLNNFTTPANTAGTLTAKMTDNGEFGL